MQEKVKKDKDCGNSKVKMENVKEELIKYKFRRIEDFLKSLNEFLLKEKFLLQKDLNERTLTHKFAEYIQKHFSDYHVDCEYNRMMNDGKYNTKRIKIDDVKIQSNDIKGTTVYPDIIIHKRGNNKDNFLVIEVKKQVNLNNKSLEFDRQKLIEFTKQLGYKFGFFICFNESGIEKFEVFIKGETV